MNKLIFLQIWRWFFLKTSWGWFSVCPCWLALVLHRVKVGNAPNIFFFKWKTSPMTGWEGAAVSVLCEKVTVPTVKKSEISKANTAHGCKPWLQLRASTLECQKLWVSIRRGINLSCSTETRDSATTRSNHLIVSVSNQKWKWWKQQFSGFQQGENGWKTKRLLSGSSEFVCCWCSVLLCSIRACTQSVGQSRRLHRRVQPLGAEALDLHARPAGAHRLLQSEVTGDTSRGSPS